MARIKRVAAALRNAARILVPLGGVLLAGCVPQYYPYTPPAYAPPPAYSYTPPALASPAPVRPPLFPTPDPDTMVDPPNEPAPEAGPVPIPEPMLMPMPSSTDATAAPAPPPVAEAPPAASGTSGNDPLMGFRPMRSQPRPGL